MLNTTFAKAREAIACTESYKKMAKALGGITKYGKDTPIPLDKIVEVCGLQDAIWALRCTIEPSENFIIEFACRCAEHTLVNFEKLYPDDKRPRQAIEASRVCITNKSETARSAAGAAAWAARDARDAAGAAAGAARAAAGAAGAAAGAAAWAAWAAAGAAGAAAGAAAWAAWDAAGAAAGDAEIEWQTNTFLEMLKNYK